MVTMMVLFSQFIHFPVHTACKMPPWAKHSLVTVEYCSNLEKLKHIIGTILEGVRILIMSARVFAHANARVRVQADLVLFRARMTKWRLLKAEQEIVNGCRQGGKKRPGRFLSNAHEHGEGGGGGAHLCFSRWQHTRWQEKNAKAAREHVCSLQSCHAREEKNLRNKQRRKRGPERAP